MIISFFGHRQITDIDKVYTFMRKQLLQLAQTQSELDFYCGGYSNFDGVCLKILLELKQEFNNIKIFFISPYITSSYLNSINKKNYDQIIYPEIENTPKKYAIIKRNQWIIDHSDFIFFFVTFTFGGAFNSLNYAKKKNKKQRV